MHSAQTTAGVLEPCCAEGQVPVPVPSAPCWWWLAQCHERSRYLTGAQCSLLVVAEALGGSQRLQLRLAAACCRSGSQPAGQVTSRLGELQLRLTINDTAGVLNPEQPAGQVASRLGGGAEAVFEGRQAFTPEQQVDLHLIYTCLTRHAGAAGRFTPDLHLPYPSRRSSRSIYT